MKSPLRNLGIGSALFVALAVTLLAVGLALADTTIVVKPTAMDGWNFQPTGTGSGGFETGPGAPPLGSGSAELKVGADTGGSDRIDLRNTNYHGVKLSDLTAMSYNTIVTMAAAGSCVAPYILLSVDVNGDGVFDPAGSPDDGLFFEPCYQTGNYVTDPPGQVIPNQCPNSGPLCFSDNVWYNWNAFIGGWWSSKYGGAGGPPLTLLSKYIERLNNMGYPNPKIANTDSCLGGVRLRAGPGAPVWNNFDGNVDNFKIGVSGSNTVYDFEYENQPIPPCNANTPTPLPSVGGSPVAVGGIAGLLDEPSNASVSDEHSSGTSPLLIALVLAPVLVGGSLVVIAGGKRLAKRRLR